MTTLHSEPGATAPRSFLGAAVATALVVLPLIIGSASATPLVGANANLRRVCTEDFFGGHDETADANDADLVDVSLTNDGSPPASSIVSFGHRNKMSGLVFEIGVPGVGGGVSWLYWNGAAWAPLAVTDGTDEFHNLGINAVTFNPPANWAKVSLNICPLNLYWVKVITANDYAVGAWANQISAIV